VVKEGKRGEKKPLAERKKTRRRNTHPESNEKQPLSEADLNLEKDGQKEKAGEFSVARGDGKMEEKRDTGEVGQQGGYLQMS